MNYSTRFCWTRGDNNQLSVIRVVGNVSPHIATRTHGISNNYYRQPQDISKRVL